MICCKIIVNDDHNPEGSFQALCQALAAKGDWLWNGGVMYFADTEGSTNEKILSRIIKKSGYTKFYIDEYDNNHEPRENADIKSWIAGKLMKITAAQYEKANQQMLHETTIGLQQIDAALDALIQHAMKEISQSTDSKETEDNK